MQAGKAVARYDAIPSNIPMTRNPGHAKSTSIMLDGPGSIRIPDEEWASIRGASSLRAHLSYLRELGVVLAADPDDK